MTQQEAQTLIDKYLPGCTLRVTKNSTHEVVSPAGDVLGRAFGWQPALKQAMQPVIEKHEQHQRDQQAEIVMFHAFLYDKHRSEFEEWKRARAVSSQANTPASGEQRAEADQKQLVHVVP